MKNLIIIFWFWRNQTLENIFRQSHQRDKHIDQRKHVVLTKNPEHAPHIVVVC